MTSLPDPAAWQPNFPPEGTRAEPPNTSESWMLPEFGSAVSTGRTRPISMSERREQDIYQRGRAQGFQEAAQRAEQEWRSVLDALREAAESLAETRHQRLHDVESNLCAAALAIARHLVMRELQHDPRLLSDLVRRGIDLAGADRPIEIRLNPTEVDRVRNEPTQTEEIPGLVWKADPAIPPGGFVIEGAQRIVDGRIDEILRTWYEKLTHA